MILKHLAPDKTFLGHIKDIDDNAKIESILATGDSTMSLTLLSGVHVKVEDYLQTDTARYVVKEAKPDGDRQDVKARLDLEDLEGIVFERYQSTYAPLATALATALTGTGWTAVTSVTKSRSVSCFKKTALEVIKKLCDAYLCEVRFDNLRKVVYMEPHFGADRGTYFIRGLNLRKASVQADSYDYYTRIIPIGADDLRINDVNGGLGYVENYQYSSKIKPLIWTDTSYTVAEDLKEDAIAKLADMSKPRTSYSADVIDLASQSDRWSLLEYGLGDTVKIIDEMNGVNDVQRIVRMTVYPLSPGKNSCELSNTVLTWEEMQARLRESAEAATAVLNSDGTVNGVYVHGISEDGKVIIETIIDESSTIQGLEESSVASVRVLYAVGTSPTTEPADGWSTTAPPWVDGQYMWQKTLTTYANGTTVVSALTCITGATGSTGVSLSESHRYYMLASAQPSKPTSISTLPPTGWTETEPGYTAGLDLYTVDLAIYSDGAYTYSDVNLSSSYRAAVEARTIAVQARDQAAATKQHFWADEDTGVHITQVPQEDYETDPSAAGPNMLATAESLQVRNGNKTMASFGSTGVVVGAPGEARAVFSPQNIEMDDEHGIAVMSIKQAGTYEDIHIIKTPNERVRITHQYPNSYNLYVWQDAASGGKTGERLRVKLSVGNQWLTTTQTLTYDFTVGTMETKTSGVSTGGLDCRVEITYYTSGTVQVKVTKRSASSAAYWLTLIQLEYDAYIPMPVYSIGRRGEGTMAPGAYSVVIGEELIGSGPRQAVVGRYNAEDTTGRYAFLVGNGTNDSNRSNAGGITWEGDDELALDVTATAGTTDGDLYAAITGLGWESEVIV